jgi:hypothetical protein
MWTSRVDRQHRGGWTMRIGGMAALVLALALTGCGTADYVTDSKASVLLLVAAVNEGAVLDSDVRLGVDSTLVCPDTVVVALALRNKNPGAEAPRIPGAVLINRYEVSYSRTDGRTQQGVDVPYTVNGSMSSALDVADSGTVDVPIEVVRRQAKLEPPLSAIQGYDIVTMFADITIAGETISGDSVTASGRLQIDFADYGDTSTSCPTS